MTFQPAPRKTRFQFLDDAAVAAHRTVQPLQIAVDHEDQVVELFARGQRAARPAIPARPFRHRPGTPRPCARWRDDAAILQIAHEARLVDGVDRAEAHGNGGELPEIRHQPGMRIRGQAGLVAQFMAEVFAGAFRSGGLRETRAHRRRAKRGPGSRPNRRADRRSCRGRND